jgi:hypothetical protein
MMPPEELRVLTVRQPHASAIVLGHKDVENRTWQCPVRSVIAIHAGKSPSEIALAMPLLLPDPLPTGAIIGVVRVADCLPGTSTSPWAIPGHWHWVLADPRLLKVPVAFTGRQALIHAPADVARAVLDQL